MAPRRKPDKHYSHYIDANRPVSPWVIRHRLPPSCLKRNLLGMITEFTKTARFRNLARNTQRQYVSVFENIHTVVTPSNKNLYDCYVHTLDYSTVDFVYDQLVNRKCSNSTISLHFCVLSVLWEFMIRRGYVWHNPWRKPGIKIKNRRTVLWKREEVNKAIEKAIELGFDLLAIYIILCYETGQRPWQDLRNLKWENFYPVTDKDKTYYVLDFVISKTQEPIQIPLSERASIAILKLPLLRKSEYMLVNKQNDRLMSGTIGRHLQIVKKVLHLNEELTMRDLRRTMVTELVEAGATPDEIYSLIGWRCGDAVIKRYAPKRMQTAENALQKRLQLQKSYETAC